MKKFLKNKRIGIIGFAKSGIAAANLAAELGAQVFITETRAKKECASQLKGLKNGIELEFGGHSDRILGSSMIIKSPGVHGNIGVLKKARRKKIPVISEVEFALRYSRPGRLVAITGTNGKTTVTTLIGEVFRNAGRKAIVAGNIGNPLSDYALNIGKKTSVVMEMSSYQLEDSLYFHPDISVILNITPDHIEHHRTMAKYVSAKKRIFLNQTQGDFCVLNYEDRTLLRIARKCPAKVVFFSNRRKLEKGAYYKDGVIRVNTGTKKAVLKVVPMMPGMHNIDNILAAAASCVCAGIRGPVIEKTINSFKGVEHRIEFVREVKGVKYYNDSKATNVDSTRVALESFDSSVWLILGGRGKGAPYSPLRQYVEERTKGIILIGEDAPRIKEELKGAARMYDCRDMKNALRLASTIASGGDVVLLSPACASFDQYKNFEERGLHFKRLVKSL